MLHPIVHDLRSPLAADYAVVAALSGVPTSRVLRLERNASGRAGLKCPMTDAVFTEVLVALGLSLKPVSAYIPPVTFKWFVREHRYLFVKGPVIVRMKKHMAVVEGDHFADSTQLVPVPLAEAPARWRVAEAHSVHRIAADGLLEQSGRAR
jgi:hypothetical protein